MKIINADCRAAMQNMAAESFDSIVSDPPYGLSFMGKGWDHGVPGVEFWTEALRVAKPGAHLLAFGGTRTFHRLACAIEDAGWEIRDCVMWVYGSGFPKSHDASKAIDKAAGAERQVIGRATSWNRPDSEAGHTARMNVSPGEYDITAPATPAAKQWQGWGTALKPAWEPIIVARKPLVGTVAANVLEYGTGAINVDGCRVATLIKQQAGGWHHEHTINDDGWKGNAQQTKEPQGRWPANLIHDGSEEVVAGFPDRGKAGTAVRKNGKSASSIWGSGNTDPDSDVSYGDSGSAARFFYCAKASKTDRDEGLEGMPLHDVYSEAAATPMRDQRQQKQRTNNHPTVKPAALMRYLCRLVTPPGGIVLDPFCGSGSTGKAAIIEGFDFVGIEQDADYAKIAEARVKHAMSKKAEELPL